MSQSREPRSLGDELHRLGERLGGRGKAGHLAVSAAWDAIVGEEIARHTTVLGVRKDELLVGVDSPAWAAELGMMAEDLVERLGTVSGENPLRGIRFAVTREVERARAREQIERAVENGYGGPRVAPATLTGEEIESIRETVRAIDNEDLREAAFRAIAADLQWKKGIRGAGAPHEESEGPTGPDSR